MKIELADARTLGITAMVGAAIAREDWTERKEYNSEELKKSADGRVLFGTRKAMLWMDADGNSIDVSVNVIEPIEAKAASRLQLGGKVWVNHYIKGGQGGSRAQLGVSIVAERLEPVKVGADA